jgi:hypothetical protein
VNLPLALVNRNMSTPELPILIIHWIG